MTYRCERVGDLLLSFLAGELRQVDDPIAQRVTLTSISVAKDCKSARVYWSALSKNQFEKPDQEFRGDAFLSEAEKELINKAFARFIPLLRRSIAKELSLRYVPQLKFFYDESCERGAKIDFLLKKVGH
jgi:ribosome-binding factor A